jgi:guanylate kinase
MNGLQLIIFYIVSLVLGILIINFYNAKIEKERMNRFKGQLFTITGPSASGKSTVAKRVFENESTSHATRQPRTTNGIKEVDGVDYHFITLEQFEKMNNNNEFCETVGYLTNKYGITKKVIEQDIEKYGKTVVVCTYEGMLQIKEVYPAVTSIFVFGSREDVEQNIRARGDKEEDIQKRLALYDSEMANVTNFDFVIQNVRGQLDQTVETVKKYIKNVN